ncbi:hypothetical protein ABFX02_12G048800 [Erythranthe guttata]
MAQIAKIEAKAEIKCSPAKFYDFWKYNMTQFSNVLPHIFVKSQLVEGKEGQDGNIKLLNYIFGKPVYVKVKTEEINDKERSIAFVALEGEVKKEYNSFVARVTVGDGSVTWCLEFEKANDSVPNPDDYAQLFVEITKGLDSHLLKL